MQLPRGRCAGRCGPRMAADAREPGRAGARSRRPLRDGARYRRDDAAERAAGAPAGGAAECTLAARYLPGTVGVDVGGDWYDVIHLDDGRIGLVVGDVVGKGVQAAAMMGQLRNALRAFAFEHDDPAEGRLAARQPRRGHAGISLRHTRLHRRRPAEPAGAVRRGRSPAAADPEAERDDLVPRRRSLAADRRRRVARVRGRRGRVRGGLDDLALHRRAGRASRITARRRARPPRGVGGSERRRSGRPRRHRAAHPDRGQGAARRHRDPRGPAYRRGHRRPRARPACNRGRPPRDAGGAAPVAGGREMWRTVRRARLSSRSGKRAPTPSSMPSGRRSRPSHSGPDSTMPVGCGSRFETAAGGSPARARRGGGSGWA